MADRIEIDDVGVTVFPSGWMGIHDEEVDADSPLSSDIAYRWAALLHALYEHVTNDPVDGSSTRVSAHVHPIDAADSRHIERVGFISAPGIILEQSTISASYVDVDVTFYNNDAIAASGTPYLNNTTTNEEGQYRTFETQEDFTYVSLPQVTVWGGDGSTGGTVKVLVYDPGGSYVTEATQAFSGTTKVEFNCRVALSGGAWHQRYSYKYQIKRDSGTDSVYVESTDTWAYSTTNYIVHHIGAMHSSSGF